ncbi:MAG: hypothetical protein RML56_07805 [Burkholderiales bacterium]|nr:hypothetical protein [Burkholderiales bacterium]
MGDSIAAVARTPETLTDGHDVGGVAGRDFSFDRGEYLAVQLAAENLAAEVGDVREATIVDKQRAEHRLLGIENVARLARWPARLGSAKRAHRAGACSRSASRRRAASRWAARRSSQFATSAARHRSTPPSLSGPGKPARALKRHSVLRLISNRRQIVFAARSIHQSCAHVARACSGAPAFAARFA